MDHRPLSGSSEAELVERAQNRDPDAFAELMSRNSSPSFRLALSVLKDRQEAEDEVQTSFMKAWVSLPRFKSEARFSTWFRTIVLNQSLMRLRQIRRVNLRSLDEEDHEGRMREVASSDPVPEARLSRNELTQYLQAEIRKLPPLFRESLVLRDLAGC